MLTINSYDFATVEFDNGEVSYKPLTLRDDRNVIRLYFESNKDITDLQMASLFIRDKKPGVNLDLESYYFPYARMNREIEGYLFSLKYFSHIIREIGFSEIYTLDNHSAEVAQFINVNELDVYKYIQMAAEEAHSDLVCLPDKGAYTRYHEQIEFRLGLQSFYCEKKRVLNDTRELLEDSHVIHSDGINLVGKTVLIVDDICCTGGTVLLAARKLKQLGVAEINLFVAHCENNVIKHDIIREGSPVKKIYTTDSLKRNYNIPEIIEYKINR